MSIYHSLGIDPTVATYLALKYGEPTNAQWFDNANPAIIKSAAIELLGRDFYHALVKAKQSIPEYLKDEYAMLPTTTGRYLALATYRYDQSNKAPK